MLPSRTQLETSVISHAPKDAIGPLFTDIVRGPILPPRGTKERDWQLRIWDQADFNSMWQGARSGLVKKIAHIPFEISGPPAKVQYYQDLLGYAHFSHGYEYLIEMWGRDFLTQSYGGIFEIAGAGDPSTQLISAPTGINHLDAGRCYVTGNTTYPILYYSLWDGRLHRMHASRVYQIVDDPIPDERYFGLGTSALERAIAVNQREVRMNQYVDARLDDMPQPGMLAISGASRSQWDGWVTQYLRDTSSDGLGPFGRTIVVTSVDPNAGVKAESIPFAQTPDKFDLVAYKSLDVDEICLAIGIDRQEIWELAGRGLGSGSQSQVMAEKAKGKTTGSMIAALERFMNWAILPDDCEFEIKAKDESEQSSTAALNLQYAQTAAALVTAGFTKQEIAKVLVEGSQTYKDAFTDDKGNLIVTSDAPGIDPSVPVVAPAPVAPTAPAFGAKPPSNGQVTGQSDTPLAAKPQTGSPAPQLAGKALETDEQRKWFFANNPEFASQGTMPSMDAGGDDESHRQALETFAEANKHSVAKHLWNHDMVEYSKEGKLVVNPENTKAAAAALVRDTKDATVSKDYLISGSRSLNGYSGSDQDVARSINRDKSQHAQAVLMAAHVGDVKLTDSQNRTMQSLAKGNYLNEKYSQYASGDRGTLLGPRKVGPISRGHSDNFVSAAGADLNAMRFERVNAKAFSITRIDFEAAFSRILARAVKGGARPNQIENLMLGLLQSSGQKAFQDGLREGGVNDLPDDSDLQEIQNIIANSIDYLDPLLQQAFSGDIAPLDVRLRAEMWANKTLTQFFNAGRISSDRNAMYEWLLGQTEKHCPDCARLNGQVHRFKDWYSRDWLPQSDRLDCGGFRCDCKLMRTSNPAQGRF